MAEIRFKRLRAAGVLGGHLATLLTVLTTNWVLTVSAGVGVLTYLWESAYTFATDQRVEVAVGAFLAVLWSFIGISILLIRKRPQYVIQQWDYAYSVTSEGYRLYLDREHEHAAFQIGVNFRNVANGPIRVRIEEFRVVIGDRTIPDNDIMPGDLVISRVSAKGVRSGAFRRDAVPVGTTVGTLSLTMIYGPHEGVFSRRYRLRARLGLKFTESDVALAEEILSETDEAI